MLMRLMSKGEYLIIPKGTKFTGSGKLGLIAEACRKVLNARQFLVIIIKKGEDIFFFYKKPTCLI